MFAKINIHETQYLIDEISNVRDNRYLDLQRTLIRFVCYFNLFECFISERNIQHWFMFHKRFYVDDPILDECFNFFKKRYITAGNTNKDFSDLCKNLSSSQKEEIINTLGNNLKNDKDKLYTLLSISYYFRNNLYHGYKDLSKLEQYKECFDNIVKFIHLTISNTKRRNING